MPHYLTPGSRVENAFTFEHGTVLRFWPSDGEALVKWDGRGGTTICTTFELEPSAS